MNVSTPLAGTITVLILVAFGTFLYPILFQRRAGFVIVAALTVGLGFLFYAFDAGTGTSSQTAVLLAVILALLPAGVGLLAWRLQRKNTPPADGGA
jgi:uncharacterized membrane protein